MPAKILPHMGVQNGSRMSSSFFGGAVSENAPWGVGGGVGTWGIR
jgi:hypothetical protein